MEFDPELLDIQALGASDDGGSSENADYQRNASARSQGHLGRNFVFSAYVGLLSLVIMYLLATWEMKIVPLNGRGYRQVSSPGAIITAVA